MRPKHPKLLFYYSKTIYFDYAKGCILRAFLTAPGVRFYYNLGLILSIFLHFYDFLMILSTPPKLPRVWFYYSKINVLRLSAVRVLSILFTLFVYSFLMSKWSKYRSNGRHVGAKKSLFRYLEDVTPGPPVPPWTPFLDPPCWWKPAQVDNRWERNFVCVFAAVDSL